MAIATGNSGDGNAPFPVVDVPPSASTPETVIHFLVTELVNVGQIGVRQIEALVERLVYRESLGTTDVGQGYAVPHVIDASVKEPCIIAGRLSSPLQWTDSATAPVRLVLLFVATDKNASFRCLERISHFLRTA
jgi:mannitol/fructose-specific phosphotransferase system IIA component (Ntr-type)